MAFRKNEFLSGLKAGFPIFLGYVSISFAFGILVIEGGMSAGTAVLISMTNLTSAGQIAGFDLIVRNGAYLEIFLTTVIINIRYALMSVSLSQKMQNGISWLARFLLPFGNTDEIFAVAMQQDGLISPSFLFGLIIPPYAGWALGTYLGATMMSLMPTLLSNALSILLYAMFVAIIVPVARKQKSIAFVVIVAAVSSIVFYYTPFLNSLPSVVTLLCCTVPASVIAAILNPVEVAKEDA